MVTWTAKIGGNSVSNIFDINYSEGETDRLGEAVIKCADSSGNRSFESGEKVVIKKNGTKDFTGYVVGKPTSAGSDPELDIRCKDRRLELQQEQVNRVFYDMDTGAIVRDAVNNRTVLKNERLVDTGDVLINWSSDVPEFEPGSVSSQELHNIGNDFIFVGWPKGSGLEKEVYKATYSSVGSEAIPGDGTIDKFITRLLINNRGEHFNIEVDLRDDSGNNYIWNLDIQGNGFNVYELKAEEAKTSASIGSPVSSNGYLEYRFRIDGELPEARAAAIDYSKTIPFEKKSRNTNISPSKINNTGRTITRRYDRSLFEMINELATEDGNISYIDTSDNLYYEPSGKTTNSKQILFNSTPVVEANFNRDYENIVNRVVVQGSGDIRAVVEDTASIQFYGISAREEPVIDTSIQTIKEAEKRGEGVLRKKAWADNAFSFTIADSEYQSVSIGEDINVNWSPENVNGTYTVTDTNTDRDGYVTIKLTNTNSI